MGPLRDAHFCFDLPGGRGDGIGGVAQHARCHPWRISRICVFLYISIDVHDCTVYTFILYCTCIYTYIYISLIISIYINVVHYIVIIYIYTQLITSWNADASTNHHPVSCGMAPRPGPTDSQCSSFEDLLASYLKCILKCWIPDLLFKKIYIYCCIGVP